ncbi:tRNA1(Val) (adenine(37)-N6)-methyltransferase [Phocicoccus pinnipedialis]|uniref:tRNA1(Val) (Adenine(37)-N6)-methyltransferase n=1 Tax=Phocicoccus pinnipedialis TaxID=110845 RepID=A0A6V7R4H3_9BACL|nr:tRNA1(Val) (adenine(37)-N6)-methyltransferase [Jeotgalicoccus pinnipedialis]MBP1940118.1 tRNA1(Val) A37 N6-methylase TrmN6 [Jeotgalicoccus pinnipedialis]CAD2071934.1 tRNA1(Val) (adenine(37)-N6)-methyltransferase [Jeotgalicoccus pinnipedialis]
MLKNLERIDELFRENMKIIQSDETFSFSVDALLLANFVSTTKRTTEIVDLCAGNGIVPLLLSHKTNAKITGVEVQERLVDMANRSIAMNDKSEQIDMVELDINDIKSEFKHSVADIVSVNPPYFKNNQPVHQNTHHQIARTEILINLESIVKAAKYLIKNKGKFYMVHRAERIGEVIEHMHRHGFRVSRMQFVYSTKTSKNALFVLVEAIFNSDAFVKVEPSFYIYNHDRTYTEEMLEVYYG